MSVLFDNYKLETLLESTQTTSIFEAIRKDDGLPVIVKVHTLELVRSEAAYFEREFHLLKKLDSPSIVKVLGLERSGNRIALILERIDAIPLAVRLAKAPFSLDDFFSFALQLTALLHHFHEAKLIHRNFNPMTIRILPETNTLIIADVGISVALERDQKQIYNANILKNILPYLSPEQSRKTEREIDHRSDLYSLGVLFYEMLVGKNPFASSDPLKIIHAHLARTPEAPHLVNEALPPILGNIILKLLEKKPENRYQSAQGLREDLLYCRQQWQERGMIEPFSIGQKDPLATFHLPAHLYGRRDTRKLLSSAFQEISQGKQRSIFIHGLAGTGKTSLISDLQKELIQYRAYFASSRCEPHKRETPYFAFSQAFASLVEQQILMESEERLNVWKLKLRKALGHLFGTVTNLIPQFEELLEEPDPDVFVESEPTELHNRIGLLFQHLVKAFATKENPLILFLDDLQWADHNSLDLIEHLVTHPIKEHFLLLAAYRDGEAEENPALVNLLEAIERHRNEVSPLFTDPPIISFVHLGPLSSDDVDDLLEDVFGRRDDETRALRQLIYRKTNNNPFFIRQFISYLAGFKLFHFDPSKGWFWDLDEIIRAGVPDDVVSILTDKLKSLPEADRTVIQLASCFGHSFPLDALLALLDEQDSAILESLYHLVEDGFLIRSDNSFSFIHNKVQEAAYQLNSSETKKVYHLKIARYLLTCMPNEEAADKMFELVEHFNRGRALLHDQNEKEMVIWLNIEVGNKAKASQAYDSAFQYYSIARELLPPSSWEERYDLAFEVHKRCAEGAQLSGKTKLASQYLDLLLAHAKDDFQRAKIFLMMTNAYAKRGHVRQAIELGLQGLQLLGISLPFQPKRWQISLASLRLRWRLLGKEPASLINLPFTEDNQIKLLMKFFAILIPIAHLNEQPLLSRLLSIEQLNLALKAGNTQEVAMGYLFYGLYCFSHRDDVENYQLFGQMAHIFAEQAEDSCFKMRLFLSYGVFVYIWRHPRNALPSFFQKLHELAVQSEERAIAELALCQSYVWSIHTNLRELIASTSTLLGKLKHTERSDCWFVTKLTQQLRLNLRNQTKFPLSLSDATFDEIDFLKKRQSYSVITSSLYDLCKLKLFYFHQKFSKAYAQALKFQPFLSLFEGTPYQVEYVLFAFLSLAAIDRKEVSLSEDEYLFLLTGFYRKMKIWAQYYPINFQHLAFLMEAEVSRIKGHHQRASECYALAAKWAKEHDYLRDNAIIGELATRFHLDRQEEYVGSAYLRDAYQNYLAWGAEIKVQQLEQRYEKLLNLLTHHPFSSVPITLLNREHGSRVIPALELATVTKALHAISKEIDLDSLMLKIMSVCVENAGAQRGVLLLHDAGELKVEFEFTLDSSQGRLNPPRSLEEYAEKLPLSVIHHVLHRDTPLMLDEAFNSGRFLKDPYIAKRKTASILCMPIHTQNAQVGLLYLENALVPGTFTEERLKTLQLLTTQAAISIENAKLYTALRHSEEEWRSLVNNAPDHIIMIDKLQKIHFINRDMLGYPDETLLGQLLYKLHPKEEQERVKLLLDKVLLEGETLSYEATAHSTDGKTCWFMYRASPLHKDEEITGALIISTDITKRKLEEEQRQNLEIKLRQQQKLESIGTLASGVAHEINNPIQGILGYAELLLSRVKEERLKTYASEIIQETERISSIVYNLLAFAREEQEQFKPAELYPIVNSVLSLLGAVFRKERILVEVDVPKDLPLLYCRQKQIQQVVMNFLTNARDALNQRYPTSHENKKIKIRAHLLEKSEENEWIRLTIEDLGMGIEPEVLKRIFDPFFTTKDRHKSTGLGLAVSHGIVKEHRGEISVESEPNHFTRFHLDLPTYKESI